MLAVTVKTKPPWNQEETNTDTILHIQLSKEDKIQHQYQATINHIQIYRTHLQIYTDASQNTQHQTEAAFYIQEDDYDKEMRLPNHTTVHTVEMCAIKSALDYIYSDSSRHDINIAIFSDSLGAIEAIIKSNLSAYNSIETNIVDRIHLLPEKNIITTTGHIGIRGNEMADRLAKKSTLKPVPTINLQTTQQDKYHSIEQQTGHNGKPYTTALTLDTSINYFIRQSTTASNTPAQTDKKKL